MLLTALAAAVVLLAPAASAHDELVSTSPQDGSSVTAPVQVALRFTQDLLAIGNRLRIEGPGPATNLSARATGPTLTASLDPDLPAGVYRVTWRAVSADGHPLSGAFGFTLTQPTTARPEPTADETATAAVPSVPSVPSVPEPAGTSGRLALLLAAVAAVGALAAGLGVAARRNRSHDRG